MNFFQPFSAGLGKTAMRSNYVAAPQLMVETEEEQISREHDTLTIKIQEETGCHPLDANLQAWIRLFQSELIVVVD